MKFCKRVHVSAATATFFLLAALGAPALAEVPMIEVKTLPSSASPNASGKDILLAEAHAETVATENTVVEDEGVSVGGILVLSGSVLTVAGATILGLSQAEENDELIVGITVGSIGIATLTAGIALLLVDGDDESAEATSEMPAVGAIVTPDGAAASISGTF